MARRKQSKSEHIRSALAELGPEARNRDIIAKLAGRKIKVSAQMVSTVRARAQGSASSINGAKRRGHPGHALAAESVTLAALLDAKRLVDATGSLEAAKQTLNALARLV